jgi:hypothetical protein
MNKIKTSMKVNIHALKRAGGVSKPGVVEHVGRVVAGPIDGKYRVRYSAPWGKTSGWYPAFLLTRHHSDYDPEAYQHD